MALWLTRLGIRVRIVDKAQEPGTTSRALAVQARTLELYNQIGLAGVLIERGLEFGAANLWVRGKKVARVGFGQMGVGLSPFPYMLVFPQDQHERLLIDRLTDAGVEVERRTELLGFEDEGGRVIAQLRRPDGTEETCEAAYMAGCDGAGTKVREALGTGFPGGTYAHLFYVADVQASGPAMNGELHGVLDEPDFLAVFPMKGSGCVRLVGAIRQDTPSRHATLAWTDVSQRVLERISIKVERVNWFSTYHVHHRIAGRFRKGHVYLLGDAAHVHSPVGGQGMNTGIGDAVNLAWKLAAVVHGRANPRLLETYEPERIAFARRLVATTDRAFTVITSRGPFARRVRLDVVPRLLAALFQLKAVRRFMFRTISQTAVNYRASSLSVGAAGRVRGGDRLPWVQPEKNSGGLSDNFTPLIAVDWQVHVYGDPTPEVVETCNKRELPLHVFPWRSVIRRTGLRQNAIYLVRPDGYVAMADPEARAASLEAYLDDWGLQPLKR